MEQDVVGFERWLETTAKTKGVDPELLAAKLVGRWRNGTPLTNHAQALSGAALTSANLDDFDYVTRDGTGDDQLGHRCPIGAHIRRLNPRGGMVLGVPWGRLLLRRGMPYGPKYDPSIPDEEARQIPRGLVGLFLCGDLESQFEFLLKVWGRQDLSSPGLRHTHDIFSGTSDSGPTPFKFRVEGSPDVVTVDVPPLTKTKCSLYLFMPGLAGLHWISAGAWLAESKSVESGQRGVAAVTSRAPVQTATVPSTFNPAAPDFRNDPYKFYADFRSRQPIYKIDAYNSYWVFSHQLITEVCSETNQNLFLKPGHNRDRQPLPFGIAGNTADGLFFMDPPRHTQVRPLMDVIFKNAISTVLPTLEHRSMTLLQALSSSPTMKLVNQFAARLPTDVFMDVMGIAAGLERMQVEQWTRAMLAAHSAQAGPDVKQAGGTAGLALRAYLAGLATRPGNAQLPSVLSGMGKHAGCPVSATVMSPDEITNTGVNFALGGFLSTQFLITTGIYNLILRPDQWDLLKQQPALIDKAIWEMLRFDAPFQMADRWVAEDCKLGSCHLKKGDKLTVVYGSANRDSQIFKNPDLFDICREPLRDRIYGFGHGIHYCIGEELALAVARAAIGTFAQTFKSATVAGTGGWLPDPYFRSLSEVTLALD
jgi:cytochrome P450